MIPDIARLDLSRASSEEKAAAVVRSAVPDRAVLTAAAAIVSDVDAEGDSAVRRYGDLHGGSLNGGGVAVDSSMLTDALDDLPSELRQALEQAIQQVTAVHESQLPTDTVTTPSNGVTVERVWTPLASVGVYVPGGRALYPSSLVMGVVPARVAGVNRVVVATPASPDGVVDPIVLATAQLLNVDEVFAMGGAQAIGALAYGTESIDRVDKIVGPGGPWVTAAKLAVYGECGIDLPAGPSEAAIVVDQSADARIVAADVMCQAEHGSESSVALIVTESSIADAVVDEIGRALHHLDRADTIASALTDHGIIVVAKDTGSALEFANAWAPEHLSIHTAGGRTDADQVPNAGSVFVGRWTPEAAGDYATGANHVLPTGGLSRAYGPLSVEDFGSWRQIQTLTRDGLIALAPTIVTLAEAEGLTAHAYCVTARLEDAP